MDFKKIPGKKERIKREVINTEKPTISIVTPYYNAKEFFEETYRCILNQTYPFFDLLSISIFHFLLPRLTIIPMCRNVKYNFSAMRNRLYSTGSKGNVTSPTRRTSSPPNCFLKR